MSSHAECELERVRCQLGEQIRENCALRYSLRNQPNSESEDDLETNTRPSKRRRCTSSTNANAALHQMTKFTDEMKQMYEATLTAQAEQNKQIIMFYRRRLSSAHFNDFKVAEHRKAELALQQKRLDFDRQQAIYSNLRSEALDTKLTSIDQKLTAIMNHVFDVPRTTPDQSIPHLHSQTMPPTIYSPVTFQSLPSHLSNGSYST